MAKKYSIGLDFGTLAARAVMVDVDNGNEVAVSLFGYQDAIIDSYLPGTNIELPPDYALQNPRDYIEAIPALLNDVRIRSGVEAEDIISIGIDSTTSTVIPLDENCEPLCFREEYKDNPHSWIKMWKHHSPQPQADKMNEFAANMDASFLKKCGGKVSAEWFFPKLMETYEKAPEVFQAASCFVELGDWIVYLLTGKLCRSSAIAAIHANWDEEDGYPKDELFEEMAPQMLPGIHKNEALPIAGIFTKAGNLREQLCEKTGLLPTTSVSIAASDSPVALLSMGVTEPGTAVLILGTSSVMMVLSDADHYIPGAMACVKNQMMPGYYGNMFGQSAVGDVFEWFTKNMLPYDYYLEAEKNGETIFQVIDRYISKIKPEEEGVLSLSWLNGCRSLLQNANLSGLLVGLKLSTRPEEIYRALVESVAFELKEMINCLKEDSVNIKAIHAGGGISRKSPAIMQILADILELPIYATEYKQTVGHGTAILGAVAANETGDKYETICKYVENMKCPMTACYIPNPDNSEVYRRRFLQYKELYNYFGVDNNDFMREIKK